MISESIFAFALVLTAAACVALGWSIYRAHKASQIVRSLLDTSRKDCDRRYVTAARKIDELSSQQRELAARTPVALLARVDELAEDVERLRLTHQRFAGRFAQYVKDDSRPDNAPPTLDREALRRTHAHAILPAGVKR